MSKETLTRLVSIPSLVVLFLVAFVAFGVGTASADDPTIPTNVTVTSGGTDPVIECQWALPDMQTSNDTGSDIDPLVQYDETGNPAPHIHDDDMTINPGYPCDLVGGENSPAGEATMAQNVHNLIQVAPIPGATLPPRYIQLWMAIDPKGQDPAVFWKVYEKTGANGAFTLKTQVDVSPTLDEGSGIVNDSSSPACGGLGATAGSSTLADRSMFEAAYDTGQVTNGAITDSNYGMVTLCNQGLKSFYYGRFTLDKEQPCGEYKIEAHAGNKTLTSYIDIQCIFYLEVDTNQIACGTLSALSHPVCGGNDLFEGPGGTHPATLRNVGNLGAGLDVGITPMCEYDNTIQDYVDGGACITQFDMKFGKAYDGSVASDNLQVLDPINPSDSDVTTVDANFGNDIRQVLCSDETGKFDLSLEIPNIKPAQYRGEISFIGRAVHNPDITGLASGDFGCDQDQDVHE
jgi:hypothetical protein